MSDQEQRYKVTIQASGEIRDKDGNLVSPHTVETTLELSEAELNELNDLIHGAEPEGDTS